MPRGAKPKTYSADLVARVREQYAAGKTQTEIADAEGLTQRVIFNLMRRHGIAARVAAKRNQFGENNHMWKGDDASKCAFHRRLYSRFGAPSKCSVCGTTEANHYDYANLSGNYEDLNDYASMCRSCHWKYDDKIQNITNKRRDADAQA
mgnify:CR=1 FL=1|tara:strand:+ start:447 stop:893 length:447 start_codon:yes stop_codon:yes gene_type:complete